MQTPHNGNGHDDSIGGIPRAVAKEIIREAKALEKRAVKMGIDLGAAIANPVPWELEIDTGEAKETSTKPMTWQQQQRQMDLCQGAGR